MKLSIMILALEGRPWHDIYYELLSQSYAFPDQVEVLVEYDKGERTSGQKRHDVTQRSKGEYICFVDDDDKVASDYVSSILTGCESGADVVTFCLDLTRLDRQNSKVEVWHFGLQPNQRTRGKMMVNHLCAWKKEIATKVSWCPDIGYADDQLWMQPLFHAGLVKTEFHIQKVLYHYLFHQGTTQNQKANRMQFSREYVGTGLRCFKKDEEIYIEVGNCVKFDTAVVVRDRHRQETLIPLSELQHYHTIQIV